MSAKRQKSIKQLERELEDIRARETALKEQIKEQTRRIRVEEAQRKQDATTYLGMLLLKRLGMPWSQIDYEKLSDALSDRALINTVWTPEQMDTKERLNSLKIFVKGVQTNDAPKKAGSGADSASGAREAFDGIAGAE